MGHFNQQDTLTGHALREMIVWTYEYGEHAIVCEKITIQDPEAFIALKSHFEERGFTVTYMIEQ